MMATNGPKINPMCLSVIIQYMLIVVSAYIRDNDPKFKFYLTTY